MVAIPSAIIFVNEDISPSVRTHLTRQLFLTQTIDGYGFDSLVAGDPNYIATLKQMNQRVMVLRTFADRATISTWPLADIVLFVKQGIGAVEVNRFGPHGLSLSVLKIYWGALGVH